MYLIKIILLYAVFSCIYCHPTLEYYENLIQQRTAAAQDYEIPENNAEFTTNGESLDIADIGSYDFIIVGAGSAGSVLATRLSEIDEWNVLLLEAGGEEDDFSKIPSMFMFLQFSEMNWGYFSTPQTHCCLGMREKRCGMPRGKLIGGSSAINAVLYSRGYPDDYNKWVELGNPGWSYEEVLPYFIKSENSQIDGSPGYHGKGGYWNVEYQSPNTTMFTKFIQAHEELNIPLVDYNGHKEPGVSRTQINIKHGQRQSTGTAFLDNARRRQNLKTITKALVTKIDIDEETKSVKGITFVTNNTKYTATATKEVLVSGGAINSPQLLMLSGIGPKKHLEDLGIRVVDDLPVGENLLEHPVFQGLIFRTNYTFEQNNIDLIEQYLKGYGILTNGANVESLGFLKTKKDTNVPAVEYLFIPPGAPMLSILNRVYNYNEELVHKFLRNINPKTDIVFFIILLHPKSKGRITLKSNNPVDFPNIDLNLYSEYEDIDTMSEGIEFILKLLNTKAFRELNATLVDIPICQEFEKYSKPFWECSIRHVGSTLFHPCGTTVMGPDKASSVVDADLKVHGIKKLRVIDAGVFPSTISGHISSPTIMVAEKISDAIKNDYNVNLKESPSCGSTSHVWNHCYGPQERCDRYQDKYND